jgi:hypothetical protein
MTYKGNTLPLHIHHNAPFPSSLQWKLLSWLKTPSQNHKSIGKPHNQMMQCACVQAIVWSPHLLFSLPSVFWIYYDAAYSTVFEGVIYIYSALSQHVI